MSLVKYCNVKRRVYRKSEVALSRISRKITRKQGGQMELGGGGTMKVCLLNWELLAVIKLYNPLRKIGLCNVPFEIEGEEIMS